MLINAQGNEVKVGYVSAVLNQEIIVPNISAIQSVEDLKGKTITVQPGTSSHYCVLKILSDNNLSSTDVHIQYMTAAEAKSAFETGKIDAWAVWAPWVEQQQVTKKGRSIKGADGCSIISVMTLSNAMITNNPKQTKAIINVIDKSKKWIVAHPKDAREIISSQLGIDIDVVKTAWPKFDFSALVNYQIIKEMKQKATFLSEQNLTRNSELVDISQYLYLP